MRTREAKGPETEVSRLTFPESQAPWMSATTRVGFASVIVLILTGLSASTTMRVMPSCVLMRTPVTSAMPSTRSPNDEAASAPSGTEQTSSSASAIKTRRTFFMPKPPVRCLLKS